MGTEVYARGLDNQDEFAADYYGAVSAARAGYDPYGPLAVLQTLSSINPQDDVVALMFAGARRSARALWTVSRTTPSVLRKSCTRT
jgi:predicted Zn-dependent protease